MLVVAIDRYKSSEFGHLSGCKNDGKRFIKFLTGVLGVPASQIVFLADEEATEREILNQFDRFLINNADIQRDDAIIFFFAGHGSRLDAPPGWVTASHKIEVLCPHDVQTTDADGKELHGISDRAIDALMRRLAFEKGDNIVCLFPCLVSVALSETSCSSRLPCSTVVTQVALRVLTRAVYASGLSRRHLVLRLQILIEKFGNLSQNLALVPRIR